MMPFTSRSVGVLALLIAAASLAVGVEPQKAKWTRRAPIALDAAPAGGIVEFALTSEVYEHARADFSDLRVLADTGEKMPYIVRLEPGTSKRVALDVRLYNRTYIPGKQSSVTVDFGRKVLKDRIEVDTPGTNFRRRIRIEGSDDGQKWQTVRSDALLFRISGGAQGHFDKNAVDLPTNDQRYLRVTAYPGQDDPERVELQGVRAWRLVRKPARTADVPIRTTRVKPKKRATEIEFDLGFRNLPLHQLTLQVTDDDFFRRVSVSGRSREKRTRKVDIVVVPTEKTYDEPWYHINTGVLYRYTSGGTKEETLKLDLKGATYRYLQVRIDNGDDPPLHFDGAGVTRLIHYVAFQPRKGKSYTLLFASQRAPRPDYDLPHYIDRLRREGVTRATLGQATEHPPREPRKPEPKREPRPPDWATRHRAILWIVLLLVLAVLAVLVYRQARTLKPPLSS